MVTLETDKSQDLEDESASWRPRRVDGLVPSPSLKTWEPGQPTVCF